MAQQYRTTVTVEWVDTPAQGLYRELLDLIAEIIVADRLQKEKTKEAHDGETQVRALRPV